MGRIFRSHLTTGQRYLWPKPLPKHHREKHNFGSRCQGNGVGLSELECVCHALSGKAGENLRESLADVLARGNRSQFGLRMMQEPMDEFFAGIAGGTDDGDLHCGCIAHVWFVLRVFE